MTDIWMISMIASVHIFLYRKQEILLLERKNTGFFDGFLTVPAGHLELGETPIEAATREVNEEVGIIIDPTTTTTLGVMTRRHQDRIDFFFAANSWSGTPQNREPSKCGKLLWHSIDQLAGKRLVPHVEEALKIRASSMWYHEFLV